MHEDLPDRGSRELWAHAGRPHRQGRQRLRAGVCTAAALQSATGGWHVRGQRRRRRRRGAQGDRLRARAQPRAARGHPRPRCAAGAGGLLRALLGDAPHVPLYARAELKPPRAPRSGRTRPLLPHTAAQTSSCGASWRSRRWRRRARGCRASSTFVRLTSSRARPHLARPPSMHPLASRTPPRRGAGNFCKIDPAVTNFRRTVLSARIRPTAGASGASPKVAARETCGSALRARSAAGAAFGVGSVPRRAAEPRAARDGDAEARACGWPRCSPRGPTRGRAATAGVATPSTPKLSTKLSAAASPWSSMLPLPSPLRRAKARSLT